MNIGIDAGALSISNPRLETGVFQFSLNFLKELSRIDKKNIYLLYSFKPISLKIRSLLGANFQNKVIKPTFGWLKFRLSAQMLINKPDIFLGLNQALPFFLPPRSLLFVHDLAFEYHPQMYKNFYHRLHSLTKNAVNRANKIIVFSQSTKDDLVNIYQIDSKKITIIPEGIEKIFLPKGITEINFIRQKYNLKKSYLLYVGSLKPIKNINNLLLAYLNLPLKIVASHQLVLVGSNFWITPEIEQKINVLIKENKIKFLDFVPRADLPALYSGAKIFISPAKYEGFGLPLAEAMACGCPVIAGKAGSQPEVLGNAGYLVDPNYFRDISSAITKTLSNPQLAHNMKEKGLERARLFSWEKFARAVYNIIVNL